MAENKSKIIDEKLPTAQLKRYLYNVINQQTNTLTAMFNNITLIRVSSVAIAAIGFNATTGQLLISFTGGRVYSYENVPVSVAEGFFMPAKVEADNGMVTFQPKSIGRYFQAQIRGKYACTEVTAEMPQCN